MKGKTPSLSLEVLDWLLPNYENKNPLNQSNIVLGITRRKGKDSRVRRSGERKGVREQSVKTDTRLGRWLSGKSAFSASLVPEFASLETM